jgi:hypothetical protein
MRVTSRPRCRNSAARQTARVVLPTPPLRWATAMMFLIDDAFRAACSWDSYRPTGYAVYRPVSLGPVTSSGLLTSLARFKGQNYPCPGDQRCPSQCLTYSQDRQAAGRTRIPTDIKGEPSDVVRTGRSIYCGPRGGVWWAGWLRIGIEVSGASGQVFPGGMIGGHIGELADRAGEIGVVAHISPACGSPPTGSGRLRCEAPLGRRGHPTMKLEQSQSMSRALIAAKTSGKSSHRASGRRAAAANLEPLPGLRPAALARLL